MENTINNCANFADALRLKPQKDGIFIGRVHGFPLGLKFIDPSGPMVLLIHARHWLSAEEVREKTLDYESEVKTLIADKKLEIEIDDRIAWFTFVDGVRCVANQVGIRLLESVLQTFAAAGFVGDPEVCHYCRKETVKSVECIEGKAVQICRNCYAEKVDKKLTATPENSAEVIPIFLTSPFAALAGAGLWAVCWMGYTLLMGRLNSGTIYVPQFLMLVVMFCIAFLVGGPVGWIIKQNRKRGKAVSKFAAILFGSLAVFGGEVIYLAWLIWRSYHVFSLNVALHVLPDYYANNDLIFLLTKLGVAVVCVVAAYEIATPKEPKLKL
ncbi:MAG: hypothetical protein QOD03_725 [Verrucomicrobiota bacterium]